jgi:hypothetical protein
MGAFGAAGVLVARGDQETAAEIVAAALPVLAGFQAFMSLADRADVARVEAALRDHIGGMEEAGSQDGTRALTLEEAVAHVRRAQAE